MRVQYPKCAYTCVVHIVNKSVLKSCILLSRSLLFCRKVSLTLSRFTECRCTNQGSIKLFDIMDLCNGDLAWSKHMYTRKNGDNLLWATQVFNVHQSKSSNCICILLPRKVQGQGHYVGAFLRIGLNSLLTKITEFLLQKIEINRHYL